MKYSFELKQTNMVKGFLILIMIFHHVFHVHMNYNLSYFSGKDVPEWLNQIANYGKVCVGGFCFLSAYGITKKLEKRDSDIKGIVISRLVKLYLAFWPIYLFGIVGTILFGNKSLSSIYISPQTQKFSWVLPVLDILGLADYFKTPMLNAHWWYTSVALYVVLLTPIIWGICKKNSYLVTVVILAMAYVLDIYSLCYVALVGIGVLCAKEDILVRAKTIMCSKISNRIIGYIIIVVLNIFGYELYLITSGLHAMPFSAIAVILFCYMILADIPVVAQILAFLGRYSANIYYIHGFIYLYWFTYTVFSLKNKVLIYTVVLISSLVISMLMEFVKKGIRYKKLEQYIIQTISKNLSVERKI